MLCDLLLPCCYSEDSEERRSRELDRNISLWMKEYRQSIKLLLLGTGESGKTTIIKQMKILHVQGFTSEERIEKAQQIRRNIIESIRDITAAMSELRPPVALENEALTDYIDLINQMDPDNEPFEGKYVHAIKCLWADAGVQRSYCRSNEYHLIECAKYFLDRLDLIASPEYIPCDQDILHCRRRTMDIQKIEFKMKIARRYGGGEQSFWMFDVGGQRGERRKWIQVFDGISAVLFLVESSGFNSLIREDSSTNRLRESLKVFTEVWNSRFLVDSGFILFLNKQDVLKDKINSGCRLDEYFPEFIAYNCSNESEDNDSYTKARSFIRDLFLNITKSKRRIQRMSTTLTFDEENDFNDKLNSRTCYWHYTIATDTQNIKLVFEDVHTMILLQNLRAISVT